MMNTSARRLLSPSLLALLLCGIAVPALGGRPAADPALTAAPSCAAYLQASHDPNSPGPLAQGGPAAWASLWPDALQDFSSGQFDLDLAGSPCHLANGSVEQVYWNIAMDGGQRKFVFSQPDMVAVVPEPQSYLMLLGGMLLLLGWRRRAGLARALARPGVSAHTARPAARR